MSEEELKIYSTEILKEFKKHLERTIKIVDKIIKERSK